jgi:hypothetical protein
MSFGGYQPCYRLYRFLVVRLPKAVLQSRASTGSQTLCAGSIILMAEQDWNTNEKIAGESPQAAKKQYQDPAFRHERVFETMALHCGKIAGTDFMCNIKKQAS